MNPEDQYLLDTLGYVLYRGFVEDSLCDRCHEKIRAIQSIKATETSAAKSEHEIRLYTLLQEDQSLFSQLWGSEDMMALLTSVLRRPWLLAGWAITKWQGAKSSPWHRGLPPVAYSYRDGRIHAGMVNATLMLTDSLAGGGEMAVIPGSHKENLTLNINGRKALDVPGATAIPARKGDLLLFVEGLWHTGLGRTRRGLRTHAHFSYVDGAHIAFLRGPHKWPDSRVSPAQYQSLPVAKQALLAWQQQF